MQSDQMFAKILVPTDGSVPSSVAQELTAFMAKKLGSRVTVLHVVAHEFMSPQITRFFAQTDRHAPVGVSAGSKLPMIDRTPTGVSTSYPRAIAAEVNDWYHQKGEEAIRHAVFLFKEEGVPVDRKLVEHADPAETILEEAQNGAYDVIVMGRSGEKEQTPHLGSVTKKVSRHAQTPVLIAGETRRIAKILVPVDGSAQAEKAVQYAAHIAREIKADVTLLYVQESSLFQLTPDVTKDIGTRTLTETAAQVKEINVDQKLASGDPAKTITRMAEEEHYDLIVMGSRGLGAVGRFLLGSVSDHVVHHAGCSVLIVK